MTVGEKIELLCSQLKIQKQKLAEDLGITPQYLSGIIGGKKNPSRGLLEKISAYLKVDIEFFDEDAGAIDIRENNIIMSHLPDDLRQWVMDRSSRPYIIMAKMIKDRKLDMDQMAAIIEIIQDDKDDSN